MLTNLDWLAVGQQFPPVSEQDRIEMYSTNRLLFEGRHSEVYQETLKRIERVIGNFDQIVSYPVVINFQKLMSLKIADLLVGEPPEIKSDENNEALKEIINESDLMNTVYQTAIDISRYGDGILVVDRKDGIPMIEIVAPASWFPVVSPKNVKTITEHVLAWADEVNKTLYVKIHRIGSYEYREYNYEKGSIGRLKTSQSVLTGLDNFAVIQISNVITSDRATGIDDYSGIDSLVSELMVRIGQISRILDKHASPSMQGPQSSLERDPVSGQWRLKTGSYFVTDAGEKVEYLTWDGQLSANFTHVERIINLIYTISEMGSAVFGDLSASAGAIPSGSALRRLMISPLAKVNRIKMRFDSGLKEAIRLCGIYANADLSDVSINWQDGLPADPIEEADIMAKRTANKATMSQKRAIMTYDKLTEEQADEEMELINEEEMSLNPTLQPPVPTEMPNSEMESDLEEESEDESYDYYDTADGKTVDLSDLVELKMTAKTGIDETDDILKEEIVKAVVDAIMRKPSQLAKVEIEKIIDEILDAEMD